MAHIAMTAPFHLDPQPRRLPAAARRTLWPAAIGLALLMSSTAFAAPDQASGTDRPGRHHGHANPREDREIANLLAPATDEATAAVAPRPRAAAAPRAVLHVESDQEACEIADLLAPATVEFAASIPPGPQAAAAPRTVLSIESDQEAREIADLLVSGPADQAETSEGLPAATAAVPGKLTVQRPTPQAMETIASVAIVPQPVEPRPQVMQAIVPPAGLPSVDSPPVVFPPAVSTPALPSATPQARPVVARPNAAREAILLEAGNGRILALPMPAANVFVADPKVAEVRPASTNSLFVFGVGAGRTTIAAMDTDGHAVAQFEITVRPSSFAAGEAEGAVGRLIPNSHIHVTPQARGLLLTGTVGSPADSARAVSILRGYIPKDEPIENQMIVQSAVQINLRVRVVEMQRNVTRALGIDWQAMGTFGQFATVNGLGGLGSAAAGFIKGMGNTNIPGLGRTDINAVVDALAQDNLLRVLAEPNLTVMSGQPGSFLAGGEFPIPVAQSAATASGGAPTISVVFKRYGVSLDFVPTVMSDGRINLHIAPEVSQLTTQGAVTLSTGTSGGVALSIPGITVRRTETTVELGSGQTFAVAGLLQDNVTQTTNGLTFLGDLPILGALFRSSAYQRQETELVILVTPYIVRPVDDPATLQTSNRGFTPPNDLERILLLRQTGANGVTQANAVPGASRIPGAAGFIVQ